jgi:hypothetical protein
VYRQPEYRGDSQIRVFMVRTFSPDIVYRVRPRFAPGRIVTCRGFDGKRAGRRDLRCVLIGALIGANIRNVEKVKVDRGCGWLAVAV